MMDELVLWLSENKIVHEKFDDDVIYIDGLGKVFISNLNDVKSIFKKKGDEILFNLMESPEVLMEEEIYYAAFKFGDNWFYYDLREEFNMNILKHVGTRMKPKRDFKFVNLGVHSSFELLNGSFPVSSWVSKAKHMGCTALGVCDKNTMASLLSLQKECKSAGIRHVFGYSLDCRVDENEVIPIKVYCLNYDGLRNLLRIQKAIMVDSSDQTISIPELVSRGGGNVIVFGTLSSAWITSHVEECLKIKEAFDMAFFQFDATMFKADRFDVEVLESLKRYMLNVYKSDQFGIPPVLICDNYYLDPCDSKNKVLLNKIAKGAAHRQSVDQYFKDVDEHYESISSLFSDHWDVDKLFEEMCNNTIVISEAANASFETGKMFMPEYILTGEEKVKYGSRHNMFLQLIEKGLWNLIPEENHDKYRKRLEEEIYIIESTNNVDYFLIQHDLVREARRRGIAVGIGRGSAGGCLISYLIGITAIDPLQYDLLFSRFLVPERCGLEWRDITRVGHEMFLVKGDKYVELAIDGTNYKFDTDAKFMVRRGEEEITVYGDELRTGDYILMDNRDLLFTIPAIKECINK